MVGYWFYFAWPVGGPATAYVGGLYIADALGGGQRTAVVATALLLAAAFATNALGLQVSARIQLVLVGPAGGAAAGRLRGGAAQTRTRTT